MGGGGGLQDFSVSPRPLGLWFVGLGLWGLTKKKLAGGKGVVSGGRPNLMLAQAQVFGP